MEEGCENLAEVDCDGVSIREDGVYIDAGENDNLIVSRLQANPTALGVFGFSFLDQNSDVIHGSIVDGVEPTFENIASGDYPVSRSLYFYIKKAHVSVIPGMSEYAAEFVSDEAAGEDGYLVDLGLIPLPSADFVSNAQNVIELKNLTASDFE